VKPLTPEEKAKLPDYPISFMPSNVDVKAKGTGKKAAQFVGPRGEQEPRK
jgi:hypothetical protein